MPKQRATVVIVEELAGQKRRVELHGAGLPHQGVAWKTEQKLVTAWYPGNPQEATQQVFGPREVPVSWEGEWHRTLLGRNPCKYSEGGGNSSSVVNPTTLRDLFDSIFYSGQRLRVTWVAEDYLGQEFNLVREGRCKTWEFPHTRLEDIKWKFEWEWQSRGGTVQKVVATRDDEEASSISKYLSYAEQCYTAVNFNAINAYAKGLKKSTSFLTLGQLEALANAPMAIADSFGRAVRQQVNSLRRVADMANKFRAVPYSVANSLLSVARNTTYICNQYCDTMSRMPPEAYTTKHNVADLTRSAKYFGSTIGTGRELARQSQVMAVSAQTQISQMGGARNEAVRRTATQNTTSRTILGVHVVKQGDTAYSISKKWYGTPDHAIDILRTNKIKLTTVRLPPGKPLVIPVLSTARGV